MSNDKEKMLKVIELVRDTIKRDNELREKFQIGDKFRFVRDRLHALLEQLEKDFSTVETKERSSARGIASGEIPVYVYLYNTQGLQFRTWQAMLNPKIFYEYSVNRPIYTLKEHVEALIRTKSNKAQHAYLTIAIKENDLIKNGGDFKDTAGHPLVKVREGSLLFEKVLAFTHHGHDYTLNAEGGLVKVILPSK